MAYLLIHTGGTIGMVQTENGFAPQVGVVEAEVAALQKSGDVTGSFDIHLLEPLLDSANASPRDWSRVASVIAERYESYDGFVVTHGTDTLAYTAAALCFALEGLAKPVIVTGAMLPLSVPGSDGKRNLLDSLRATHTAPHGVWVQFAGQLMHGARVRKSHSTQFDAFRVNEGGAPPVQVGPRLKAHSYGDADVAILAMAPGLSTGMFQYAAEQSDALLLRVYGSGTAPESAGLVRALRRAQDRGIPVLAVSQCPEGGMALGTYAAGAVLRDNGVIDGRDMTVEAAYAKLHHALSWPGDPIARLNSRLCGEFI
ncbi:asparaginase [Cognatishimia maritima]|uniref:L-asparaginase n=1 Tax=Cognatishimia maritima TaxID=870908 RepID=A0A1M5PNK3_9RHOB|nr:asparaginase [Cognatishimia maritima]SHH03324.1 L-asparaginase [Cognatishimia maritima]